MVEFNTIILQFGEQGEKTGWTYIEISADIAQELKPGNRKSFRVKGMLDGLQIKGMALMPMGEGTFILVLKAEIRKAIHKGAGAMLQVKLEEDTDVKVVIPNDVQECFDFDPEAREFFNSLAEGHRRYFINWINSAKTNETRAKRIVNMINAMIKKWDFGKMSREMRKDV
jgi:hypothetical protein